ncbi:MAG: hypothetical protein NW224_20400 [Leptolyngbyaceae cyanobacterium bins.302]|nr:hypothetical protein [Leptolyngbyaceae cyanobacterium bins.302]
MAPQRPDESLGLEHLPQSQVEAVPSSITAPVVEVDATRMANIVETEDHSPQVILRSLISDNGLIAVLEAFQAIMENQIERLQDSSMQSYAKQLNAFQVVANDLSELIDYLPAELDIELALTQITHTAPTIEEAPVSLAESVE